MENEMEEWITCRAAADLAGVKVETIYSYLSKHKEIKRRGKGTKRINLRSFNKFLAK